MFSKTLLNYQYTCYFCEALALYVIAAKLSQLEFKLGNFWLGETAHVSHFGTITSSWILIGSLHDSLSSLREGLYKMLKDCWPWRRCLRTFHTILSQKRYQRSKPWTWVEIFLSLKVLHLTLNSSFMKYWGSFALLLIRYRQLDLGPGNIRGKKLSILSLRFEKKHDFVFLWCSVWLPVEIDEKNRTNKHKSLSLTPFAKANDYTIRRKQQLLQIHKAATKAFKCEWNRSVQGKERGLQKLKKNVSLLVKSFVLHKPPEEHVTLRILGLNLKSYTALLCIASLQTASESCL